MVAFDRNPQDFKYLRLLSRQFPTEQSAFTEIINLSAILNLPKGTEHFMSDVHGEYEAFMHILNNCSGVVREHVDEIFGDTLSFDEKGELCTLIYYPREKIELVRSQREDSPTWYRTMLDQLIMVARSLRSSSAWPSTTCTWWAISSTAAAARPRLWTACSPTIRWTSSGATTTCCGGALRPVSPPASPR